MKAPIILLSVAMTASGCAFGNRSVTLTYPPSIQPGSSVSHQAPSASTPLSAGKRVVLVPFLDQRPTKLSVGVVHNGYGMHTADAVAANSVPAWVMKAIKTELARQGFEVVEAADIPQTSEVPIITGDVITVMCQAYTHYESTIEFSVIVSSAGALVLQKTYKGVDESSTNWGAGADSFGQSLAVALQTAADNFALDFKRLTMMTQHP